MQIIKRCFGQFVFWVILSKGAWLFSQTVGSDNGMQQIENAAAGDEYNPEDWAEDMEYLRTNPINLNTCSANDLGRLRCLNSFQVKALLDYRSRNGLFASVYELKLVYGWDDITVRSVLPFVVAADAGLKAQLMKNKGEHRMLLRSSIRQSDDTSPFFTRSAKVLSKYYYDLNDRIHAGAVNEKDYGETAFSGSNRSMDYASASLVVNNPGRLRSVAAGDYHACFGQGLILWTGFGFGKTPGGTGIAKNETGFTRYSSLDENRAMRGAAATVALGRCDVSVFYSMRRVDANAVYADSSGNVTAVSSLHKSGLHASPSEIKDEKILPVRLAGTAIRYQNHMFSGGLLFADTHYGYDMLPENNLSNFYQFRGHHFSSYGINYKLFLRKTEWFGEAALMDTRQYGLVQGVLVNLYPGVTASAFYRNYSQGYYAPYSRCFSENTDPENEQGLFMGLQVSPVRGMKINGYSDFFSHPWLKYYANSASHGRDYSVDITYAVNDQLIIYARHKRKYKQENSFSDPAVVDQLADKMRSTTRLHLSYRCSEKLELRNRIELSQCSGEVSSAEKGYYLHQDIVWRSAKSRMSLWFRYAVFSTDSYESRIYAYENDLPYAFSMPAFFGTGSRSYLVFKYRIRSMEVSARGGITLYEDDMHGETASPDAGLQLVINL